MQYIDCLYWAFTTMVTVGYGDICGMNTNERLFNMIAMIMMAGVYAFALSEIGKRV
jgi:low temperature requirement protein LtrA